MYHPRLLENKITTAAKNFKVLLVVGARQVGKSTLLSHLYPKLQHITFEERQDLFNARQDPDNFLRSFPAPIILDEVQYVPDLLSAIKRHVDQSPDAGQYFMTGSQNILMLKELSESMAGRVGIFQLGGITYFEENDIGELNWVKAYLDAPNEFHLNLDRLPEINTTEYLLRGNLPWTQQIGSQSDDFDVLYTYHQAYIKTYIQRDVRILQDIRDLDNFDRFLGLSAALTAQEINAHYLGWEVEINPQTALRWLNILKHSYLWAEIQPYHGNTLKRLSKHKKGFLTDTGIACSLLGLHSPLAVLRYPGYGALFESYCISMIQAICSAVAPAAKFYHWRTNGGAEVDLIIDYNGVLYPVEIKSKSTISKRDCQGLRAFRDTYPKVRMARSLVLFAGNQSYFLDEDTLALPWYAFVKGATLSNF